jgi:hypothetical protein
MKASDVATKNARGTNYGLGINELHDGDKSRRRASDSNHTPAMDMASTVTLPKIGRPGRFANRGSNESTPGFRRVGSGPGSQGLPHQTAN